MSESLLRISEILLFGRVLDDLKISVDSADQTVVAVTDEKISLKGPETINGVVLQNDDLVLVNGQSDDEDDENHPFDTKNHVYKAKVNTANANWDKVSVKKGDIIKLANAQNGDDDKSKYWVARKNGNRWYFKQKGRKFGNKQLQKQWGGKNAQFARIFGFSFEGTYYELPNPTLFLVQSKGKLVTPLNKPGNFASRAPSDPSRSGVAAADFQFADEVRVWDYDKADYTIRMDVETGMFEQVLLDVYFGDGGGSFISGSKVSGSKVSGSKVSGSKVSGSKLRGPSD